MKKMMLLGLVLMGSAFGADFQITSISISAGGGSPIEVKLMKEKDQYVGYTVDCNFRELNPEEQKKTRFVVEKNRYELASILANDLTIATQVHVQEPGELTPSGYWQDLEIFYTYKDEQDKIVSGSQTIRNPMVLIDYKISPVLDDLQNQARIAAGSFCLNDK